MTDSDRISVHLAPDDWNLVLCALEYRYGSRVDHPEYMQAISVGTAITRALENAELETGPESQARHMREEVERRMSVKNKYPSRFSETDRQAVESVLVDIIREHQATSTSE